MLKETHLERQHSTPMPRHRKHRHTSLNSYVPKTSLFTFSCQSIACERHPHRNEDSMLIDEETGLAAVFDGVGGSAAGEIASQTAARATLQAWKRILRQQQGYYSPHNAFGPC